MESLTVDKDSSEELVIEKVSIEEVVDTALIADGTCHCSN